MPKPKVETRRVSTSSNKLDNEKRRHLKEKREKRKKEMKEDKHHKEPKNKHKEDNIIDCIKINPGGRALIPTELYCAIPEGYEIQVRPRSGLALKHGITVLNTPGTVDSGYRNSIGVILINQGTEPFEVRQGDRIAQFVLNKYEEIEWVPTDNLEESERGLTGFGDSGVK